MIPYPEIHYHPEYAQLAAVVGKGKLGQEHWPEWARLQERYGWRMLVRAADRCEPLNRWPATVEHECVVLTREQDAAKVEATNRAHVPTLVPVADRNNRAADFAAIRQKHGV